MLKACLSVLANQKTASTSASTCPPQDTQAWVIDDAEFESAFSGFDTPLVGEKPMKIKFLINDLSRVVCYVETGFYYYLLSKNSLYDP